MEIYGKFQKLWIFLGKLRENMESDRSLWNNCNLWNIYGDIWTFKEILDMYGHSWKLIELFEIYGKLLENMESYGKLWKIVIYGNLSTLMEIYGKLGNVQYAHGNLWKIIKLWKFMEKIKVMDIYRQ